MGIDRAAATDYHPVVLYASVRRQPGMKSIYDYPLSAFTEVLRSTLLRGFAIVLTLMLAVFAACLVDGTVVLDPVDLTLVLGWLFFYGLFLSYTQFAVNITLLVALVVTLSAESVAWRLAALLAAFGLVFWRTLALS
jgi:hypothetical protein